MMKSLHRLLAQTMLAALALAPALHAQAQDEGQMGWQLKGFVDSYHAMRIEQPQDMMASRTRMRAEIGRSFGESSCFLSLNAKYNALLKEQTGFELREAYVDHRAEHWGFRLGRQLVIWGAADGLRITDLVSPLDMREFLAQDYDDIRMPINAIRLFLLRDMMQIELIAIPSIDVFRLPTDPANPWSLIPKDSPLPIVWHEGETRPKLRLSNLEYGGRISFNLPGIDFSLAGLHTWNKMPILRYEASPTELSIKPAYYRMGFLGGDISKPLGAFVLRGELAYMLSKHFSYQPQASHLPQKGFNSLNWLLAIDWYAANEWMLSAQFSSESIFKYQSYLADPEHTALLTLHVSKKLLGSSLELSNFSYFDLKHRGCFSRFTANYALNDQIRLYLGGDYFAGKEGVFAQYKKNSQVWIKAKYSF